MFFFLRELELQCREIEILESQKAGRGHLQTFEVDLIILRARFFMQLSEMLELGRVR